MAFEILYQDEYIVAINKPFGYLVHRTELDEEEDRILVYDLGKALGKKVYSIHRLDKKTTGVILFAFDTETVKKLHQDFRQRKIRKTYLAVVRGQPADMGEIESELVNINNEVQWALTHYEVLEVVQTPPEMLPHFPATRYSLLKVYPITGRMHQIRKHLNQIFHPIIGDRTHGNLRQNIFFNDYFDFQEMMLHAYNISFTHPITFKEINIKANVGDEFLRIAYVMGFSIHKQTEIHPF
ncbi:MAG: pseudouridine synthase [Saprospiraceae bacterium]